jgi:hypothetical protein
VGGKPSERERTWEMVEDVLRSVSPLFAEGWNSHLLQKLQALVDAGHSGPDDEEHTPAAQSQ